MPQTRARHRKICLCFVAFCDELLGSETQASASLHPVAAQDYSLDRYSYSIIVSPRSRSISVSLRRSITFAGTAFGSCSFSFTGLGTGELRWVVAARSISACACFMLL